MQRKDGNLNGKGYEKGERGPEERLRREGRGILREDGLEADKVEGSRLGIEPDRKSTL